MGGLLGDILTTSNSLMRQSTGLKVIGDNLSNVNNSSYARKSVETSSFSGAGGAIYTSSSVTSARDSIADRQVVEETYSAGALQAKTNLYDSLNNVMAESLNGSLGASLAKAEADGTGITGGMAAFFNSWSALATTPNSGGSKAEVYSNAEELASRLNSASSSLDDVQESMNDSLDADIKEANALMKKIATLNSEIVAMEARETGSSLNLQDERQAAMEDLAEITNFESKTEDDGSVTLTMTDATGATQTLVEGGNAAQLSVTKDADGKYTGISSTFNGATNDYNAVGGSLSVLDPAVTSAAIDKVRGELDAVAKQLITSVNEVFAKSSDTGDAKFFDGTGAADIALNSSIKNASDIPAGYADGADGSNDLANDMADLLDKDYTIDLGDGNTFEGTMTEAAAQIATDTASALSTATDASERQQELLDLVTTNRNNISGTSTDEELSSLVVTQHAYQASARILSTVNTLLDLVTTRLGA